MLQKHHFIGNSLSLMLFCKDIWRIHSQQLVSYNFQQRDGNYNNDLESVHSSHKTAETG